MGGLGKVTGGWTQNNRTLKVSKKRGVMKDVFNPYATALDGLVLEDPVTAFFDFCRERERIRLAREAGSPSPWSDDPVFQQGRFLNVFREDDRVSKAVIRCHGDDHADPERLVQRALFARWCNRDTTLDALPIGGIQNPAALKACLEKLTAPPWCNVTAYPVEPVTWQGKRYSRLETATTLFHELRAPLCEAVWKGGGDVMQATLLVNEILGMTNDFPIFMAMIDLAWFRPDMIEPSSHVPTGIGAVAFLDRLQAFLGLETHQETCDRMIHLQGERWPEAKRPFQPIDVEYLACECRKYYSYINGTKAFEGKNRFLPGQSPRIMFEPEGVRPPSSVTTTGTYVIAGPPCSGKTTLLNALRAKDYAVERETAEVLLEEAVASGTSAEDVRADAIGWQKELLERDHQLFQRLAGEGTVFADTSFIETLVYSHRAGIVEGPNLTLWLERLRYRKVFFLEALPSYEQSEVRLEDDETSAQISAEVKACYERYGYELVLVPPVSVSERVSFIERHLAS
jgi:predicted ATPase